MMAPLVVAVRRHVATDGCDGFQASRLVRGSAGSRLLPVHCGECDAPLCSCELTYGHDCE